MQQKFFWYFFVFFRSFSLFNKNQPTKEKNLKQKQEYESYGSKVGKMFASRDTLVQQLKKKNTKHKDTASNKQTNKNIVKKELVIIKITRNKKDN